MISIINPHVRDNQHAIISLRSNIIISKFERLADDIVNCNQNLPLVRELLSEIWIENKGLENIKMGESVLNSKNYISICLEYEIDTL